MREVLSNIFNINDFKREQFIKSDYYTSNKKLENYIVYELEELSKSVVNNLLDNNLYDLELELIEAYLDKEMKKNTSVIFLVKVNESKLTESEKKLIFKIEEDPYFYKKYVLWYSENEAENISSYIENMTDNLMNKDLFENMKDSMLGKIEYNSNIHAYELLCRIFIKLPFLTLKPIYTKKNELSELKQYINKKLSQFGDFYNELSYESINLDMNIADNEFERYLQKIELDIEC